MHIFKRFSVTVAFKNEGEIYGTENYTILARNEDEAERKALVNASGSDLNDDRLPARSRYVKSCHEIDNLAA